MPDAIIVALITSAVTLIGVLISNSRSDAVQSERIEQLRAEVKKHNGLVEKVYHLEQNDAVQDAELKRVNARLEKGGL